MLLPLHPPSKPKAEKETQMLDNDVYWCRFACLIPSVANWFAFFASEGRKHLNCCNCHDDSTWDDTDGFQSRAPYRKFWVCCVNLHHVQSEKGQTPMPSSEIWTWEWMPDQGENGTARKVTVQCQTVISWNERWKDCRRPQQTWHDMTFTRVLSLSDHIRVLVRPCTQHKQWQAERQCRQANLLQRPGWLWRYWPSMRTPWQSTRTRWQPGIRSWPTGFSCHFKIPLREWYVHGGKLNWIDQTRNPRMKCRKCSGNWWWWFKDTFCLWSAVFSKIIQNAYHLL